MNRAQHASAVSCARRMTQRPPKIVQSEHLAPTAANWLRERASLVQIAFDHSEFNRAIADADALVVRTYTRVDAHMLDLAPRLRVVGRAGAGIDNIDVAACRSRNVEVVYAPDANTQAVVEYVIALACDALRPRRTLA